MVKPLAVDEEADVVLLGLNAAASALHLSAVPWLGPTAAVRVGLVEDKVFFIIFLYCFSLLRSRKLEILLVLHQKVTFGTVIFFILNAFVLNNLSFHSVLLQFVLNPSRSVLKQSSLDLLLTGCGGRRTVMIEMDGDVRAFLLCFSSLLSILHISSLIQQVPTEKLEEAIDVGLSAADEILTAMDELRTQAGKEKAEV